METINENLSVHQLLNVVSEFSKFLEHGNAGNQEIIQHLCRSSFVHFGCLSVHLTRMNSNNELLIELMTGTDIPKEFADTRHLSLESKFPIVDVFQSGKIMWINTLPDWGVDYPLLKDYPIDFHGKTFIAFPLVDRDIVTGVLSLVCGPQLLENKIFNNFFSVIAGLMTISVNRL